MRALLGTAAAAIRVLVVFALCAAISACASFDPKPLDGIGFHDRAVTRIEKNVTISAVALGPAEAQAAFGVPMMKRGIQPVWVRISNDRDDTIYPMLVWLDPYYFTPTEAAFINHIWLDSSSNAEMDELFQDYALPEIIDGHETVEGFLFVTPDLGAKPLNFLLAGDGGTILAQFVVLVPGLATEPVDYETLFDPDQIQHLTEWDELKTAIEALPCCVTDSSGAIEADPLNFVIIAEPEVGLAGLVAGGWDAAETVNTVSAFKTTVSYLFGSAYRYSPVSNLYAFGRKQDAAYQIARSDIHERNHLRVWLTPLRFRDTPVWIGAISRDIGVIASGLGTTHKIDPMVDSERWYLAQSFVRAQSLKTFGYAKGGPVSDPDDPRSSVEPKNIYYSDGLRIVMELSDEPVSIDEIEVLDWEEFSGDLYRKNRTGGTRSQSSAGGQPTTD